MLSKVGCPWFGFLPVELDFSFAVVGCGGGGGWVITVHPPLARILEGQPESEGAPLGTIGVTQLFEEQNPRSSRARRTLQVGETCLYFGVNFPKHPKSLTVRTVTESAA